MLEKFRANVLKGNFFRCVRARANLRALMTQKSCAVGMRSAILRNHLITGLDLSYVLYRLPLQIKETFFIQELDLAFHVNVGSEMLMLY